MLRVGLRHASNGSKDIVYQISISTSRSVNRIALRSFIPVSFFCTESQLESPAVELPPLQVKDLPTITTNDSENFYKLVSNMVKQTKASSGLIWNTFNFGTRRICTNPIPQTVPHPKFSYRPVSQFVYRLIE